jgi:hypothetical protein
MSLSSFQLGAAVQEKDGQHRLVFEDANLYREFVNSKGIGERLIVTFEEDKEHRSKSWEQCKYWWAVPVQLVAEHCGMTDRQANTAMLGECFGYVDGLGGKPVAAEPSLADLSVEKMTQLIEWVLDWCPAALEIICPPPDKNWKKNAERIRKERRRHAA